MPASTHSSKAAASLFRLKRLTTVHTHFRENNGGAATELEGVHESRVHIKFGAFQASGFVLVLSNNYILWRSSYRHRTFTRSFPWFADYDKSIESVAIEPGPQPILLITTREQCVYKFESKYAATGNSTSSSRMATGLPSLTQFARSSPGFVDPNLTKREGLLRRVAGSSGDKKKAKSCGLELVINLRSSLRRFTHSLEAANIVLTVAWRSPETSDLHLTIVLRSGYALGINVSTQSVVSRIALGFTVRLAAVNAEHEDTVVGGTDSAAQSGGQRIFLVTDTSAMSVLSVGDDHELTVSTQMRFADKVLAKVADMSLQTLRGELGVGLLSQSRRMHLFQASTGYVLFELMLPYYPKFVKYCPTYMFLVSYPKAQEHKTLAGVSGEHTTSRVTIVANHFAQRKRSKRSNDADRAAWGFNKRKCVLQEFVIHDEIVRVELVKTKRQATSLDSEPVGNTDGEIVESYDLLLMSRTTLYKVSVSRHLENVFFQEICKDQDTRDNADDFGTALRLDVLTLYEKAADHLSKQLQLRKHEQSPNAQLQSRILSLYQDSNCPVDKVISFLAATQGPMAVSKYLEPLLPNPIDSDAPATTVDCDVVTLFVICRLYSDICDSRHSGDSSPHDHAVPTNDLSAILSQFRRFIDFRRCFDTSLATSNLDAAISILVAGHNEGKLDFAQCIACVVHEHRGGKLPGVTAGHVLAVFTECEVHIDVIELMLHSGAVSTLQILRLAELLLQHIERAEAIENEAVDLVRKCLGLLYDASSHRPLHDDGFSQRLLTCFKQLVKHSTSVRSVDDYGASWTIELIDSWLASEVNSTVDLVSTSSSACAATVMALYSRWYEVSKTSRQHCKWQVASLAAGAVRSETADSTALTSGAFQSFREVFRVLPIADRAPCLSLMLMALLLDSQLREPTAEHLLDDAEVYIASLGEALFRLETQHHNTGPESGDGRSKHRRHSDTSVTTVAQQFLRQTLPKDRVRAQACLAHVRRIASGYFDDAFQYCFHNDEDSAPSAAELLDLSRAVLRFSVINSAQAKGWLGAHGGPARFEVEGAALQCRDQVCCVRCVRSCS